MFKRKKRETGRIGLIHAEAESYGLIGGNVTFEIQVSVEELSRQGKYSQVKVRDVKGLPAKYVRQAAGMVEEFIPTDEVEWLTEG